LTVHPAEQTPLLNDPNNWNGRELRMDIAQELSGSVVPIGAAKSFDNSETGSLSFEEVQRSVTAMMERQRDRFLDGMQEKESAATVGRRKPASALQTRYARAYFAHRHLESDWEMARMCYGEIVGEDTDVDGDEVMILDNPSPALLDLIHDMPSSPTSPGSPGRPGIGLATMESVTEPAWFGLSKRRRNRIQYAETPTLEFFFVNAGDITNEPVPPEFQKEFLAKLQQCVADPMQDLGNLAISQTRTGRNLVVGVKGPGKLLEAIRDHRLCDIQVLNYFGRLQDSHPTVIVKKKLLMPYAGIRGRSGGLNFVVDLLQHRDGFIGTGADGDPTPERMLFGVFDPLHQPHPDFWRKCLPKFMNSKDFSYTYEVNNEIALVQAPQSFAAFESQNQDMMVVLNGMSFNIVNVIRNRCGGVTSSGSNAIWQINARELHRQGDDVATSEYFDSRTKIEDTATSHRHFCKGKRSVYVHEHVATGIAMVNGDYLCAMQRSAEGSVQLFWLQLFVDRTRRLVFFGGCIVVLIGVLCYSLYGPSSKDASSLNLFCDADGRATLFLGESHPFCTNLVNLFDRAFVQHFSKADAAMEAREYMRFIDASATWLLACMVMALVTIILACRGSMPVIVRTVIMTDNLSYWMTSCSIIFWFAMALFMLLGMQPPLMFNASQFMLFVLVINITQHGMINSYASGGDGSELAIWGGQQAFTLAAPLSILSILRGTAAAWGLTWHSLDKSFASSKDYWSDVIRVATVWVTFIWLAFVFCAILVLSQRARQLLREEMNDSWGVQQPCQFGALLLLGHLAITVWEPFLNLWGFDKTIDRLSKGDKDHGAYCFKWLASFLVWWRGKAWIVRYVVDFVLPVLVLIGFVDGAHVLTLAAYATSVQGLRG